MKKLILGIILSTIIQINGRVIQAQESLLPEDQESSFFQTVRANQKESYITFGGGIGNIEPLIFEALVAPYFLLRTSKDAKWGATISPVMYIRMYNEYSFPVRTPSYMPQVTFYRMIGDESKRSLNYLFLNLVHHSNGQDDDFFNEDGSINTLSGDFSTDYLELGAFFTQQLVPFSNTREYFKTSIEYHPDITRVKDLEGRYCFLRWNNSFRVFRFFGSTGSLKLDKTPGIQSTLKTTWMFGNINDSGFFDTGERFNISFTIAYRPRVLSDVSFFANFYSGKDYYNMQFDRRLTVLRFGLQAFAFR
jgi:hypothetical protein